MDKKYKLKSEGNRFRITALRDIPRYGVKAGDKGGRVSGEHNLSQEGDCWIKCYAVVRDNAFVCDNAVVYNNALMNYNVVVCDDAIVRDSATVWGFNHTPTKVGGTAVISGTTRLDSGTWKITPKVIYGSRWHIVYNAKQISIGCECHSLEWWEEHGLALAKKDGFIHEQIEEYREHLNAIKKEYADGKEVQT